MRIKISNVSVGVKKYLLYSLLISIGNVFFSDNEILGTIFSYAQIVIPLMLLIFGKINTGICYMLIAVILGLSYDMGYGAYTGMWYTVKTIKFLGVNLGFWILLPFLFFAIISKKMWKSLLKKSENSLTQMVQMLIVINTTSLVIGIVNVFLINDNNIQSMENYLSHFIGLIYTPFLATLMPLLILYWRIIEEPNFVCDLKDTIESIFISMIIAALISFVSGNVGIKMDTQYVWISVAGVFLPYFCIFPFYNNKKNKTVWIIWGILGLMCGLYFFSNGKMMLSLILLVLILIGILLQKENRKMMVTLFSVMIAVIIIFTVSDVAFSSTRIMQSKFNYALRLLDITNKNWWDLIPPSPKWRLVEIINITLEYISKPYMFILGKGLLGTVTDYTGYLGQFNGNVAAAAMEEWNAGLFFSMHETFNVLYLRNGMLGIWSIIWIATKMIKYYKVSPYVFIGGIWYIFYFGYSYTVALFGVVTMLLGFYEISQKRSQIYLIECGTDCRDSIIQK